jgi:hypothetical protein
MILVECDEVHGCHLNFNLGDGLLVYDGCRGIVEGAFGSSWELR